MVRRSARNAAAKPQPVDIIELSSDSEPDVPDVAPPPAADAAEETVEVPPESPTQSGKDLTGEDDEDQPLLRVQGIKYETEEMIQEEPENPAKANEETPGSAKLPVQVKDEVKNTGSSRHRHVSIEILLPTSSMMGKGGKQAVEKQDMEDDHNEEVFKTPMERRHITFNDSDNEEFVTPMEAPQRNPLELSLDPLTKAAQNGQTEALDSEKGEEQEQVEDDSDDEAPEAVSTHAAGAQIAKASKAAAKAAEEQAAAAKRKRQERAAFLQKQAEERKRTQAPAPMEVDDDDEAPEEKKPAALFPEKRKRSIPGLLPDELLSSDDEDDVPASGSADGTPKRRKGDLTGPKWIAEPEAPRDKKVGSTAYRVVEDRGDSKLAPKMKKTSISMREQLLHRNRVAQRKKGGFFVKAR